MYFHTTITTHSKKKKKKRNSPLTFPLWGFTPRLHCCRSFIYASPIYVCVCADACCLRIRWVAEGSPDFTGRGCLSVSSVAGQLSPPPCPNRSSAVLWEVKAQGRPISKEKKIRTTSIERCLSADKGTLSLCGCLQRIWRKWEHLWWLCVCLWKVEVLFVCAFDFVCDYARI